MSNTANRILLADYLTGQQANAALGRNYVINQSAFQNVNNVAVSGTATVARNTTTPLTSISDFAITLPNNATDGITWSLNTLDNALKNQNCELRFTYTASSMGSNVVAQVLQGANVVATSSALPATTNPQPVSLNAPCGDLSAATTVVITNSTANSGTSALNISGVAYGKSTNLNQASQATVYGTWYTALNGQTWGDITASSFTAFSANASMAAPTVTAAATAEATKIPSVLFSNMPPGTYEVTAQVPYFVTGADSTQCQFQLWDGTQQIGAISGQRGGSAADWGGDLISGVVTYTAAQSSLHLSVRAKRTTGTGACRLDLSSVGEMLITVKKYPTTTDLVYNPSQTPASWKGHFNNSCAFTVTASAFSDLTNANAGCNLVEDLNRNFGTVSPYGGTGASAKPGIVFTPTRAGRYFVCASFYGTVASASSGSQWDLSDTSGSPQQINTTTLVSNSNAGTGSPVSICGIYDAATTAAVTLRVRGFTPSGGSAQSISTASSAPNSMFWSIAYLDSPIGSPYLMNQVSSNTTGQERIERARITNNGSVCAVSTQSGTWLTTPCTRNSAGNITVAITSGIFSGNPACTLSPFNNSLTATATALSSTSMTIVTKTPSAGTATDSDLDIICMGPR